MKNVFMSVLHQEAAALGNYSGSLDRLDEILECMLSANKIVLSGVGKSGLIARKIAATLSSTGSPSLFLHPVEAMHGDLGIVSQNDFVIAISYSGESAELNSLLPHVRLLGVKILCITKSSDTSLAQLSDFCISIAIDREACLLNIAPTTSTTLTLAIGDALAVCLMKRRGFGLRDFAMLHPGGSLGRDLFLQIKDIMQTENLPLLSRDVNLRDAVIVISEKRLGTAVFTDDEGRLVGVLSDGDLRRAMMESDFDLSDIAYRYATKDPKFIDDENTLAIHAMDIIRKNKIQLLVVTDSSRHIRGLLHLHMLLQSGFIM